MSPATSALRALLAENRPATNNVGYPLHVREQVAVHVQERRGDGDTWAAIANDLGVSRHTVAHWARSHAPSSSRSLVPVVIEEPVTRPESPPTSDLAVVSPRGFQLTGLSLDDAVVALERLG